MSVMRVPSCWMPATARESESLRLLLRLEVQVRRRIVHPAEAGDGAGAQQQVLGQGRLARARMARQDDVAQARDLVVVHARTSGGSQPAKAWG
jgi:hypothetical protein